MATKKLSVEQFAYELGSLDWLAGYPFQDNPCNSRRTRSAWYLGWKTSAHNYSREHGQSPIRHWRDKK
jgi:hypothetical protein